MNWIQSKYQNLPDRDRKLLWIFVSLTMVAAYLFWAAMTWQQMFHVEKMANRKANRIETRLGDFKMPEVEEAVSEKNLSTLQQRIQTIEAGLRDLGLNMLPLDESGPREQLKLELTRLAESNDLLVGSFRTLGSTTSPPVKSLSSQGLRDYFNSRPSFELSLNGRYFGLVDFIDGLGSLSYQAYVGDFEVELNPDNPQELRISLRLFI